MERNMETEIILTEEERAIMDDLEKICEEEIKFERQMEIEKKGAVARSTSPAVEAFRSFCDTNKDLAEYLNSIMEEVKQRVADGGLTLMIVQEMYEKLDGEKKEAFENSTENEVERQKKDKQGDGINITARIPLFEDFIVRLLEKQRERQENKEVSSAEEPREVRDEILDKGGKENKGIEDGAQAIDDTLQEAGDGPEVVEVKKESKGIVNESKSTEGSLIEGTNEAITEEYPKSESDIEIEKWNKKNDGEKKEDIEKYRKGLEEEKENLLAGEESIEDRIEALRGEVEEFAEKRAAAAMKVRESLSGVDTPKLEGIKQEEVKEIIGELAKNARNNLDVAKLDYLLIPEENLMNMHKDKEITIENLGRMADSLKEFDSCLEKFESMSEDLKIEARKEALISIKNLEKFLKKHPEKFYVMAAAGVLLGLALFLSAIGAEVPAWLTEEFLFKAGAIAVGTGMVVGGAWHFVDKEHRKELGKLVSGGAGILAGAGILGLNWLLDGKRWENAIKDMSKADYPDWYKSMNKFFGLEENETSKS